MRTPQAARLRELLLGPDVTVTSRAVRRPAGAGLTAEQIGTDRLAGPPARFRADPQQASLEEAFMQLTDDSVDYRSHDATETAVAPMSAMSTTAAPTAPAPGSPR